MEDLLCATVRMFVIMLMFLLGIRIIEELFSLGDGEV